MNLIAIGNRIKQSRKAQKYTQETLAEKLDVSPHYIYEIERGSKTMSLKMLMAISDALSLSTDYILFGPQANLDAPSDSLDDLLSTLSTPHRKAAADILSAAIPHLK